MLINLGIIILAVINSLNFEYQHKACDSSMLRELEINMHPILGKIFVRIQGVVTGA